MEVVNLRKSPEIVLGNFKSPLSFPMSVLRKGLRTLIAAEDLAAGGCLIPIKIIFPQSSWIKGGRIKKGPRAVFGTGTESVVEGRLLVLAVCS